MPQPETWGQPTTDPSLSTSRAAAWRLGPDLVPAAQVDVFYHYGFPADLGGGTYRRRAWLVRPLPGSVVISVDGSGDPGTFGTVSGALADWVLQGRPNASIRILDNRTYAETITIEPADNRAIAIEAADGFRPHLRLQGPLTITGSHETATVTLGGLLIEGAVSVEGSLGRLRLLHSTLVPGLSIAEPDPNLPPVPPVLAAPSVSAAAIDAAGDPINTELRLELAFSIVGAVRLLEHADGLYAFDSIIDGTGSARSAASAAPTRSRRPCASSASRFAATCACGRSISRRK